MDITQVGHCQQLARGRESKILIGFPTRGRDMPLALTSASSDVGGGLTGGSSKVCVD